jgi:hypothetical protein
MSTRLKFIYLFLIVCLTVVMISSSASPQGASDTSTRDRQLIESLWRGKWLSDRGFLYSATARLHVGQDFSVEGQIAWVMERSPRTEDQPKLGLGATEYVRGKFLPQARVLRLEGYRKDDPHAVIGLDKYHLVISDNDLVLGGITWNHGDWGGLITLVRTTNP